MTLANDETHSKGVDGFPEVQVGDKESIGFNLVGAWIHF